MVAPAGAGPCPHRTVGWPPAGARMIGTSPAGPFRCGSTTCSVNPAATAASNAFPPSSNTAIAAAEASQWVADTMPNVPCRVGLVVNTTAVNTRAVTCVQDIYDTIHIAVRYGWVTPMERRQLEY